MSSMIKTNKLRLSRNIVVEQDQARVWSDFYKNIKDGFRPSPKPEKDWSRLCNTNPKIPSFRYDPDGNWSRLCDINTEFPYFPDESEVMPWKWLDFTDDCSHPYFKMEMYKKQLCSKFIENSKEELMSIACHPDRIFQWSEDFCSMYPDQYKLECERYK